MTGSPPPPPPPWTRTPGPTSQPFAGVVLVFAGLLLVGIGFAVWAFGDYRLVGGTTPIPRGLQTYWMLTAAGAAVTATGFLVATVGWVVLARRGPRAVGETGGIPPRSTARLVGIILVVLGGLTLSAGEYGAAAVNWLEATGWSPGPGVPSAWLFALVPSSTAVGVLVGGLGWFTYQLQGAGKRGAG